MPQCYGYEAEARQMFEVFVGNLEQADGLELIMVEGQWHLNYFGTLPCHL